MRINTSRAAVADLDLAGTAQGDVIVRGGSKWQILAPGAAGQLLRTNGAAANPSWFTLDTSQNNALAFQTDVFTVTRGHEPDTYTLRGDPVGTPILYVSGLRRAPGVDYTLAGRVLTPSGSVFDPGPALSTFPDTATVVVDYWRQAAVDLRAFPDALTIADNGAGAYNAFQPAYTAHVNAAGYLTSFVAFGVEMMGAAMTFGANAQFTASSFAIAGDTLTATCEAGTTIAYQFRPDGITITLHNRRDGYSTFTWTAHDLLLGVELMNDGGSRYAGDAIRFVDAGEVRGLPTAHLQRRQKNRWHATGFALDAYFQRWGADFNYEEAGHVQGRVFTRNLINENTDFPYVLTIQGTGTTATLPAVPYTPTTAKVASLYYTTEPVTYAIDLGVRAGYQYLLDAGIGALACAWQVFDVHDRPVSSGTSSITLSTGASTSVPVTVTTPGSGYYSCLFTLTDAGGRMLPSQFRVRFSVIRQITGMTNRDDTLTPGALSDFAVVAMIGIGGVRQALDLGWGLYAFTEPGNSVGWISVPTASPALWWHEADVDNFFNIHSGHAAVYGSTWWTTIVTLFVLNADQIRALMQYLVARYRDRCSVFELENEPNAHFSAADYMNNVVVAAATGAAAAGGGVTLLGPCGVSVLPNTIPFLTTIYAGGHGALLGGISTHTYTGNQESWEEWGNVENLAALQALMTANGDSAKPIWQTEQSTDWASPPKAECARYGVRQFVNGWRAGILPRRHYWYMPQASGWISTWQAGGGEEPGNLDAWMPVATAQRVLAEQTHGKSYATDVAGPYRGVLLAKFTGGAEDLYVAWTWDFAYTLAFDASGLQGVSDWMGNAVVPGTVSGHRTLALSGEPVYIRTTPGSPFTVQSTAFGADFALASAGSTATGSSAESPAANAIDGSSVPGETRTAWRTSQVEASPDDPHWITINFGQARTIKRFVALCQAPTTTVAPRDWQFQVDTGGVWQTVAEGIGTDLWVLSAEFPAVTTARVRLFITKQNDGWFRGGAAGKTIVGGPTFARYTDMKTSVVALEVYGN